MTFDMHGYLATSANGHPLYPGKSTGLVHRMALYDAIGPGEHPCHHCGRTVSWDLKWPKSEDALCVDHLDRDRKNNDPSNLVPSCYSCNQGERKRGSYRMTDCPQGHALSGDNVYWGGPNKTHRSCLTCRRNRAAAQREKLKAARLETTAS